MEAILEGKQVHMRKMREAELRSNRSETIVLLRVTLRDRELLIGVGLRDRKHDT